jgi:AcrR family transcriptional regulator
MAIWFSNTNCSCSLERRPDRQDPSLEGVPVTTPSGVARATRRRPRRAGRNRDEVLAAAARVVAERGVDQTRFADVSDEAGVPISTLQYYFGSREDLILAVFDHSWRTEHEALAAALDATPGPWDRITLLVRTGLEGFSGTDDVRGRLLLEAVRMGIRDPETRADVLSDYTAWRELLSAAIVAGTEAGTFSPAISADEVALVTLALVDGTGLPLALADPAVDEASAVDLVLHTVGTLLNR